MSEAMPNGVLEAPEQCFLNLRGDASKQAFVAAVAACAGLPLPATPCTFAAAGERSAYWLGPDEWLLAAPAEEAAPLEMKLRGGLDGLRCALTDVSGACVAFDLVGAHARETLQRASPCDFHPQAFKPGRCVQTVFAKTSALIAATADNAFRLVVRSSYADYVRRWLAAVNPPSG